MEGAGQRGGANDYAAWRRVYDGFADTRKRLGLAEAVYRSVDDPSDVTVTHEFASVAAAQAFAQSPELRAAMHDAGVAGAPTVWFAKRT